MRHAAQGDVGVTLKDTVKVQKLGCFQFPTSPAEDLMVLQCFSVAEDTHKGPYHPLT